MHILNFRLREKFTPDTKTELLVFYVRQIVITTIMSKRYAGEIHVGAHLSLSRTRGLAEQWNTLAGGPGN